MQYGNENAVMISDDEVDQDDRRRAEECRERKVDHCDDEALREEDPEYISRA